MSIVHGGIRTNNVLVIDGSDLVYLTDFEFCGFEGVNKYPAFLNHTDINWPDGATDGAFLRFEHDLNFMNRLMNH